MCINRSFLCPSECVEQPVDVFVHPAGRWRFLQQLTLQLASLTPVSEDVCTCMHIFISVCIFVCVYECVCHYMRVCKCVCVCVCVYICECVCIALFLYMFALCFLLGSDLWGVLIELSFESSKYLFMYVW